MKFIATLLSLTAALAVVSASAGYGGSSGGSYGASIPAPPCPKNYLFSCQPNLVPAPCAPAAAGGGYGSAGAYSHNIPTIVNSPYGHQGLPINLQQFPNVYGQNIIGSL